MTKSILFVCLGNICRSPSAEGVFRAKAQNAKLDILIDSAGTADWHSGKQPYGPMQEAAMDRGYDLSTLQARQVRPQDFKDFDLIIAMDEANKSNLLSIAPSDATAQVILFLSYAPQTGRTEVPDPYYTRNFDEALDLIEAASDGLIKSF